MIGDLQELLREHFNLHETTVVRLDGYDCDNFAVTAPQRKFILKIYPVDTVSFRVLQAENEVLKTAELKGITGIPSPFPNLAGDFVTITSDGRYVRLLGFVEGGFLDNAPKSESVYESFGRYLANLNLALKDLRPGAIEARRLDWDIQHYKLNRRYLDFIVNPSDRSLVEYFLLQNEIAVDPCVADLRKGLLHGDAHASNVLTKDGEVVGIIDFGDSVCAPLIFEVAVALTYVMFESEDPFEFASAFLRGYHEVLPLFENEISLLHNLVATRLCISVCHSAEAKTRKPDDDYVTVSEEPAWELLHKLAATNPLYTEDRFRTAVGFKSKLNDTTEADRERRTQTTSKALSITFERPIKMESAAFQYMFDSLGNAYLDCYNNIPQVGHCHPAVVKAGQNAMARLNTNTRYLNETYNKYAESLLSRFPPSLTKVFFVNSGSAASDLALRLAMAHTETQA